jgi:hypothetical protein
MLTLTTVSCCRSTTWSPAWSSPETVFAYPGFAVMGRPRCSGHRADRAGAGAVSLAAVTKILGDLAHIVLESASAVR